ncbi:21159_t:CDS:2, partial [Racocetra persica]
RKEVDEFRSVVSDSRFDFGVIEEKISDEAYNSAEISEHDIIVTTYRDMCRNIENLIAGRLSQRFRVLEDRCRFLEDRRRFLEDRYLRCDRGYATDIPDIDNTSNSDIYQETNMLISLQSNKTPPICAKSKSSEDKKLDGFLDQKEKEKVSDMMIKKNR